MQGDPRGHLNQPLRKHVWTSKRLWTRRQLDREREEFFDTRVTGRPETWNAIRLAIENIDDDLGTAQTILDAAGVTLPTGNLVNGAYDEVGNHYHLPEHCVADPSNVINIPDDVSSIKDEGPAGDGEEGEEADILRETKGKDVVQEQETITVRARLSDRGGADVQVMLGQQQSVRVLARRVEDAAGVSPMISQPFLVFGIHDRVTFILTCVVRSRAEVELGLPT